MKPWALLVLTLCVLSSYSASAEPLTHVRIDTENAASLALELERAGFDVLEGSVTRGSLELIISAADRERLLAAGHAPVTLAVGRPFREIQEERQLGDAVPPGYPDLATVLSEMLDAATAFPSICQFVDLTDTYGTPSTTEGNSMFALKISDNVTLEEDEPSFLMVADHHAREIVTPVLALYAIEQLTTQYGSDPTITGLVNSYEIWVAPVWNPDGYEYVFDVNNFWRKNRHVFAQGIGVDQNRNYPHGWDNPCSGSTDPGSQTYKGPSPGSEAETITMMAWSLDQRFAKVLDYHSSGREVLHGYACWSHPFDAYLQQEAIDLSIAAGYGGDRRGPSADGEHYQWQFGKMGAYANLIETHSTFQPSYASAQAEAALVWPGTIWMLERPIPLWGHVTDVSNGQPVEATISYVGVNFQNGETNSSGGPFGRYQAFLPAGSYDVVFEAENYQPQTIAGVLITSGVSTQLDVELVGTSTAVAADPLGGGALLLSAETLGRSLRYEIGRPANVTLRVFDVRGALVRTLVEDYQAPGRYEISWPGVNDRGGRVASGSYYYRLSADSATRSGKLLLVK
jgi:hypothetical protein